MLERIVILLSAFGSLLLYDGFALRNNKLSKLEITLYIIILLVALYLGLDYVIDRDWMDMLDGVKLVLGGLSAAIEDYLNVKK